MYSRATQTSPLQDFLPCAWGKGYFAENWSSFFCAKIWTSVFPQKNEFQYFAKPPWPHVHGGSWSVFLSSSVVCYVTWLGFSEEWSRASIYLATTEEYGFVLSCIWCASRFDFETHFIVVIVLPLSPLSLLSSSPCFYSIVWPPLSLSSSSADPFSLVNPFDRAVAYTAKLDAFIVGRGNSSSSSASVGDQHCLLAAQWRKQFSEHAVAQNMQVRMANLQKIKF